MKEQVRLSINGGIARITLCDVANRNAIGKAMGEAIDRTVTQVFDMPEARAILLDSEGPYFSVGGDLREMRDAGDGIEAHVAAIARSVNSALQALTHGPLPVVSAWSGMAAGGGIGFALCGDIVVAGESGRLTPGFTRSGLTPDTGITWQLPHILGHARAFAILALNPDVSARQALEMRLVNHVMGDDALPDEAMRIAESLAAMPAGVLSETKRLLRFAAANTFSDTLAEEALSISRRAGLADTRKRLEHFFAR